MKLPIGIITLSHRRFLNKTLQPLKVERLNCYVQSSVRYSAGTNKVQVLAFTVSIMYEIGHITYCSPSNKKIILGSSVCGISGSPIVYVIQVCDRMCQTHYV